MILAIAMPGHAQGPRPQALAVQHTEINGQARIAVALPNGLASHVLVKGHYVLMRFSGPVAIDLKPFTERYKPELLEARLGGDGRVVYIRFDESIRLSHRLAGSNLMIEWRRPVPSRPQTSDAGAAPSPPAKADTPQAAGPAPPAPAPPALAIRIERDATGAAAQFAWSGPVAAAAFEAGDRIVFAFLAPPPRGLAEERARLAAQGIALERLPADGATLLSWRAGLRLERVERAGNVWRFRLGHAGLRADPGALQPILSRDGTMASFAVEEAAAVVRTVNPATGLPLHVVLSPRPGAGLGAPRRYVAFRLLAAAQGAAIEELADGLSVRVQGGRIDVARGAGLWLSPPQQ